MQAVRPRQVKAVRGGEDWAFDPVPFFVRLPAAVVPSAMVSLVPGATEMWVGNVAAAPAFLAYQGPLRTV